MANFKIGETIENNCNNGQGICCANCKYLCDTDKWKACSESCLVDIKIKGRSCLECKHQPKWMQQMDKCKTCIKINECEHDLAQGDCSLVIITVAGEEISVSDYLKTLVKNEIKRSKGNEVSDKKS